MPGNRGAAEFQKTKLCAPSSLVKITAMLLLGAIAIVLYADLRSVHQIYRIAQTTINAAPDAGTRQALAADRDKRDREERGHKLVVGAGLAVDLAVLALMIIWVLRSPRHHPSGS